jgi:hypothetical protein
MIRRFLFWFSARLPCRIIGINDNPYLERYYVGKLFGVTCYLHRFIRADADRDVHDHPWRLSVSVIVCGGYLEERVTCIEPGGWRIKQRQMHPGKINIINQRAFHRIASAKPETWTLFFHTSRIKQWGFLQPAESNTLVYFQPFDVSASASWEKKAQYGADVARTPLWGGVEL